MIFSADLILLRTWFGCDIGPTGDDEDIIDRETWSTFNSSRGNRFQLTESLYTIDLLTLNFGEATVLLSIEDMISAVGPTMSNRSMHGLYHAKLSGVDQNYG